MQDDNIFIRLVEAVEAEGGELLLETHFPETLTYAGQEGAETCGCGLETQLSIPYDVLDLDKEGDEVGPPSLNRIKVCAIDDAVHLWPRFAAVL